MKDAKRLAPSQGRLVGRRIVVVGGGTRDSAEPDPPVGIGRAICLVAAREGATVLCVDRIEAAALETADQVRAEGGHAMALVADASKEADCERVVEHALATLGGIDGLVLNVGVGGGTLMSGTTSDLWDRIMSINVRSHFLVARAALPHLSPGSSTVFIGSTAGLMPGSLSPAYDTSKSALAGLCRHVAREAAAEGGRANVVHPGLIDTPLGRLATRRRPERAATWIPLGHQGTALDVAELVAFLLSQEAGYITGQCIAVDGGQSSLGLPDPPICHTPDLERKNG